MSWKSRLQKCVALSTTEAEYIAVAEGCKDFLWLKKFLQDLGFKHDKYVLYCDNQSTIHLSKNSTFHSRSKHIDVRYHWIRDVLEEKLLQIHTDKNGSDMMTKPLNKEKFEFCRRQAGMIASMHVSGGGVCCIPPHASSVKAFKCFDSWHLLVHGSILKILVT